MNNRKYSSEPGILRTDLQFISYEKDAEGVEACGDRGYYQEWGKEARELHPGDIVNIPANVKHWHGAAPDSWFSHLAIEIEGEDGSPEWCEAVSDVDCKRRVHKSHPGLARTLDI